VPDSACLPISFYNRSALIVARELLGMYLVRRLDGVRLGGIIVETEAYQGEEDRASHARAGLTPRTIVMYGPPGRAYIYFTYGMHWMLNCVTEPEGFPAAVLLRAIQPVEGLEQIAARRPGQPPHMWCNGPAKLCQALAVDQKLNGTDLCDQRGDLWIEAAQSILDSQVITGPRVGIFSVPEPWFSKPWRFRIQDIKS
jgi:DNA-3-methyladenine glycosylase